jgi:hypothetical protein
MFWEELLQFSVPMDVNQHFHVLIALDLLNQRSRTAFVTLAKGDLSLLSLTSKGGKLD